MKDNLRVQLVWGIALCMAGIGVFFRIPQVMPQIKSIPHFLNAIGFIYFSFYLLGILLVAGGVKKLRDVYRKYREIQ